MTDITIKTPGEPTNLPSITNEELYKLRNEVDKAIYGGNSFFESMSRVLRSKISVDDKIKIADFNAELHNIKGESDPNKKYELLVNLLDKMKRSTEQSDSNAVKKIINILENTTQNALQRTQRINIRQEP